MLTISAEVEAYSAPTVCELAGCTYRQLDYWCRLELLQPSIREAHGSGSQRLFSLADVNRARFLKTWGALFINPSGGNQDTYGLIARLGPRDAVVELRRALATLEELLPELD